MYIKAGLIGCGFIGQKISDFLSQQANNIKLNAVCDIDEQAIQKLSERLAQPPLVMDLEQLVQSCQLIIECASVGAAQQVLELGAPLGKDILIISVGGALLCKSDWQKIAAENGSRVFLPSGAIGGLDALKGALSDSVRTVKLSTRKPPQGLANAPKILQDKIDLNSLAEPLEVFSGTAREAICCFPQNINVAATLSLAGIGPDRTMVSIIADPSVDKNIHQIEIDGDSGRLTFIAENNPAPDNPKTSYLAALSTIATLKNMYTSVRIGT